MTTNISFSFDESDQEDARIIMNAHEVYYKLKKLLDDVTRLSIENDHKTPCNEFKFPSHIFDFIKSELTNITTLYKKD